MANYTIAVGWSGKDALADSNANKIISGADFNTEFSAVQTAVNTKADLAGSASQAFSATTANAGTNTTQVATTAFVTTAVAALDAATINALVYPVGSIYFNAAVATNPATLLGFGTWAAYGAGRVMVGKAASGTFDTLNGTMGAETDSHALSIAELPAHGHPYRLSPASTPTSGSSGGFMTSSSDSTVGPHDSTTSGTSGDQIGSAGSGSAHSHDIVQPSIVVYMWKRTA
jgi:hypothetical protein